ncbi:MAG: hypothetical protein Q9198_006991 [Flavoplaca austrocitrina]
MARGTSFHCSPDLLSESLLVLRWHHLVTFGDEIRGRDILPRGAGKFRLLNFVRLCDQARFPERCFVCGEVVVELLGAAWEVRPSVRLEEQEVNLFPLCKGEFVGGYRDLVVGRFPKDSQYRLSLVEHERREHEKMNNTAVKTFGMTVGVDEVLGDSFDSYEAAIGMHYYKYRLPFIVDKATEVIVDRSGVVGERVLWEVGVFGIATAWEFGLHSCVSLRNETLPHKIVNLRDLVGSLDKHNSW